MKIRKVEISNYSTDDEMQELAELFLFLGQSEGEDYAYLLEEFKSRAYISPSLEMKLNVLVESLSEGGILQAFSANAKNFRNLPIVDGTERDTKKCFLDTSKSISTLISGKVSTTKINCPHHYKISKVETMRLESILDTYVKDEATKLLILNTMNKIENVAVKDVMEQNQDYSF